MNVLYTAISCAVLGALSFGVGIFVYLRNRSSNVNKLWMILNLSVSLWSWPLFARDLVYEKTTGLFLVRLCYVGAIFIPPLFFHFVSSLLKLEKNRLIAAFYALSVIFLIFDLTPLFIKDVGPILSFRHYGIPGTVYPFYALYFISITGYSHYILIKYFRKSEGQRRNQIRYFLYATIIGFLGGVSTFLPNFNIEVFPFGFYLISVYVVIISYAIAKHRLMDINIVFKKGTTYALLILFLLVPSCILILLFQKLVYGNLHYLLSGFVLFLLLLVAILFS